MPHAQELGPNDSIKQEVIIDPICGMQVNSKQAAATSIRDGKTFYFCFQSFHDKYECQNTPTQFMVSEPDCCELHRNRQIELASIGATQTNLGASNQE